MCPAGTPYCLLWIRAVPQRGLKVSPFETVYGRPFQISVLGTPSVDLECESKIKLCKHLGQKLTTLHKFSHCRSIYLPDEPLHLFQLGLTKDLGDSRP